MLARIALALVCAAASPFLASTEYRHRFGPWNLWTRIKEEGRE